MAKSVKLQEVAIDLLKPYERNAKMHPQDQVEKIMKSIEEFGFLTPCVIDSDYNLIAGHGRVQAAKEMGIEAVPCVFVEGLTEAQRKAYILADNRLGELGEWDMDLVSEELENLKEEGLDIDLTGFNIDDILFEDIEDIDIVPAEQETESATIPKAKRGEVWILGRHRIMCGDSTDPEDMEKLMGGGSASLLETDPPYNVAVEGKAGTIENDDMPDEAFYDFLCKAFRNASSVMKEGASFYIWHADSNGLQFRSAAEASGLTIRQNLIWVKSHFTIGRQDYQWKHEPCLYGWKEGAAHYFLDIRSLNTVQEYEGELLKFSKGELIDIIKNLYEDISTVWHADKPVVSELHPTMKPVSLIKKQIRNSSVEKDIVLDPFGGSGTTLIACEEMNRRCYMMEYDPHYCDVIINRWEGLTGEKAVLLNE